MCTYIQGFVVDAINYFANLANNIIAIKIGELISGLLETVILAIRGFI